MERYNFKELNENKKIENNNIDLLRNIEIPYSVRIGHGKIQAEQLMDIKINQLIPLNKNSSELFPLIVGDGDNKKIVAYGQIVEDNEQLLFIVKKINNENSNN
jgi:flagellar motor switch/type III secretory pathway protein FliN